MISNNLYGNFFANFDYNNHQFILLTKNCQSSMLKSIVFNDTFNPLLKFKIKIKNYKNTFGKKLSKNNFDFMFEN